MVAPEALANPVYVGQVIYLMASVGLGWVGTEWGWVGTEAQL